MSLQNLVLEASSGTPLYRQLSDAILQQIESGAMRPGDRLPPTRELAARLSVNRTTVSAAYACLEEQGLIRGHVGRGSFVSGVTPASTASNSAAPPLDWQSILPSLPTAATFDQAVGISFANSRPGEEAFPIEELRAQAGRVLNSPALRDVLQLGSPLGYPALRAHLLEAARAEGVAGPHDELLITNGCQQALDLLARLLAGRGETVVIEDPVYRGARRVFEFAGASVIPAPVGPNGVEPQALDDILSRYRPRLVALTPSFQNPTGATIPRDRRPALADRIRSAGAVLIESDIYTELRYTGEAAPALKHFDTSGNTVLLRSYSKVAFPGLRVGWIIASRPLIRALAELKQMSDLHSDHLAQAVLLEFARSGALAHHLETTRRLGRARLEATLSACARYFPRGTRWTPPEGGMNLWVELPRAMRAASLLERAQRRGVSFVPGTYFSEGNLYSHCLRLSFAGLDPGAIEQGIRILGEVAAEHAASPSLEEFEEAPALV